jgi:hypothetical protein
VRLGTHVVETDRQRCKTHGREQVEDRPVPGVLYRHAVANAKPRCEHPLDAVERTANHRQVLPVDPVSSELPAREPRELAGHKRLAVEALARLDLRQSGQ